MNAMEFFEVLFQAAMILVPVSIAYLLVRIGLFFKEITERTKQTEFTINEMNKTIQTANEIVDDVQDKMKKVNEVFEAVEQSLQAVAFVKELLTDKFSRKEK